MLRLPSVEAGREKRLRSKLSRRHSLSSSRHAHHIGGPRRDGRWEMGVE